MTENEFLKLRDASGILNRLLGELNRACQRSYPAVSVFGSQCGEYRLLSQLLPGEGTYVDIGAGEPVQCSNTWEFYQRGWRGLLVEPLFWYWPALLHQRPGDYLYDVAVRDYTGMTRLRVEGSVSSVIPSWEIDPQCNLLVPCERTADLLAKFPEIRDSCRLCSIDVEGAEREVLEGIDWTTFRPEVICVEYIAYDSRKLGPDISGEWREILATQSYREFGRTQMNVIYQRGDLFEAREEAARKALEEEAKAAQTAKAAGEEAQGG